MGGGKKMNLICTLAMLYLLFPIFHIKAKYQREKLMNDSNRQHIMLCTLPEKELSDEEKADISLIKSYAGRLYKCNDMLMLTDKEINNAVKDIYYTTDNFSKRFQNGILLEAILALASLIIFILTEDIRKPMVLIDKWTPIHIILLAIALIIDIRLIRYRKHLSAEYSRYLTVRD